MTDAIQISTGTLAPKTPRPAAQQELWDVAQELEVTFLAEMLKSAGLGESRNSFGGGIGEEQFSSFLRTNQARLMVDAGGIGLAEHLFNALKESTNDPI